MDAFAHASGRVLLAAGVYDEDLAVFCSDLLTLTKLQENALVRPMSTRNKLDMLQRLAAHFLNVGPSKAVTKYCENTKKVFDERNSLVHASPGHDKQGRVSLKSFTGKNKLTGKPENWDIDRLNALVANISKANEGLAAIRDHFEPLREGHVAHVSRRIAPQN